MIRKLTGFLVMISLVLTTAGISVSKHYCGTSLVSVTINHEPESCCGDMDTSGCCDTETSLVQLNDFFIPVFVNVVDHVCSVDLLYTDEHEEQGLHSAMIISPGHAQYYPPPTKDLDTSLALIQVFLC